MSITAQSCAWPDCGCASNVGCALVAPQYVRVEMSATATRKAAQSNAAPQEGSSSLGAGSGVYHTDLRAGAAPAQEAEEPAKAAGDLVARLRNAAADMAQWERAVRESRMGR